MKILKSIQRTAFLLLIFTELIYAQDFKIAPKTALPTGSNFSNVSIASDPSSGFLVTWLNTYKISSIIYFENYACRFSKTGEMLDSTAILLGPSHWPYFGPNAVFAGGNWIVVSNQGGLFEWVGAQRLTPAGAVLDSIPVNIADSEGMATMNYPSIATNGNEILCVMYPGSSLYGSIFDSDLNILVNNFFILEPELLNSGSKPQIAVNGNNFFITFINWERDTQNYPYIKLVIINPQGQILSIQNVSERWDKTGYFGVPTITTVNDTTYIIYYHTPNLFARRYLSDGQPIDSQPVKLFQSPDFESIGKLIWYPSMNQVICHWTDLSYVNDLIHFFLPRLTDNGISMYSFKPDLSIISQPASLDGQCQIAVETPEEWRSFSLIRVSSLAGNTLTAWIDEREGNTRVYGNFFDIVNPVFTTSENVEICEGEEYEGWMEAGTYQRTLVSASGCDSVVTTYLTVNPVYEIKIDTSICEGESFKGWKESGTYTENFTSINGCDSVVITNLTVNAIYEVIVDTSICQGDSYKGWNETGQYIENLVSAFGCDSTVITNLIVNPVFTTSENVEICEGEKYEGWTEAGTYERTLVSASGCDSIIVTNLFVHESYQPEILVSGDTLKSLDSYPDYQWCDENGEISGANEKEYVIEKSDEYYLIVTDTNGCAQTSQAFSLIYSDIKKNKLGIIKYSIIPNPNTGEFVFRIDTQPISNFFLKLINPIGQVIETRHIISAAINHIEQFNVKHLSKGMYFLYINTDNHQRIEKIIIF